MHVPDLRCPFARLAGLVLVVFLLLTACAGEQSFREGRELLSQGKVDQGLAKLQQATRDAPTNPQFRTGFLRERERNALQYTTVAESLRANGQLAEAEAMYRRALEIDSTSELALLGLREVQSEAEQRTRLREAQASFDKKDYPGARDQVRSLLRDNPRNRNARALLRRIEGEAQPGSANEVALRPRLDG